MVLSTYKIKQVFFPFARFHLFFSFLFFLSFQYPTETSFFVLFFSFFGMVYFFFLFNSFNSRKCMRVFYTLFVFFQLLLFVTVFFFYSDNLKKFLYLSARLIFCLFYSNVFFPSCLHFTINFRIA